MIFNFSLLITSNLILNMSIRDKQEIVSLFKKDKIITIIKSVAKKSKILTSLGYDNFLNNISIKVKFLTLF